MKRSTAIRDRHRATIARSRPPCHICGEPIDYSLPHWEQESFVVDHLIPLAAGGTDTLDNKAAAHRKCNRDKGARPYAPIIKRSGSLKRPGGD